MKKTLFLFGSLFLTIINVNAQLGSNWDWASISGMATWGPGRQVIDIATDNAGNVYAVGRFQGNMTIGGYTVATSGDGSINYNFDEDAFVVKYNSSGQAQWLKNYGTNQVASNQVGQVINVDSAGNVYIGGSGNPNAFLVKYDANGNLLWSKTDFQLFEIGGINNALDGNIIVQESSGASKNIYKIDSNTGTIIWTVANTGVGSNSTTTFQDFVDDSGNIYYTCFGTGAITVAGQNFSKTQVTTFIASLDGNGVKRWVQDIDNVQVQLSYTIDNNGKSYIQIGGGFGGTFQGVSTGSSGGNRYLELDKNGVLTRYLFQSPYKGLFRVKNDAIYGFTTEQEGYAFTLSYGSFNFYTKTDNTKAFGIVIRYDKTTDAVTWANSFEMKGSAWASGKLKTIEISPSNKIIVGGTSGSGVIFGTNDFSITSSSGGSVGDLFISQGTQPSLGTELFSNSTTIVYPNPATNMIHIKGIQKAKVVIYNIFGQAVLHQKIEEESGIDVSSLISGNYIIEVANENGEISKTKLIKI